MNIDNRSKFKKNIQYFLIKLSWITILFLFLIWMIGSFMKSSIPYKMAIEEIKNNSMVAQKIGTPILIGASIQGEILKTGDTGFACFKFPVSGSIAKGMIYLDAKRQDSKWKLIELFIEVDNQLDSIMIIKSPLDYKGDLCWSGLNRN